MIPFLASAAQAERLALKKKLGLALRRDPLRLTASEPPPELHPLPSLSDNGSDDAASMMHQQPCPSPIWLDSWDMMMAPAAMADLRNPADGASCTPAPEEPCMPGSRADLAAADDGALPGCRACSTSGSKCLRQLLFGYQAPFFKFPPLLPHSS